MSKIFSQLNAHGAGQNQTKGGNFYKSLGDGGPNYKEVGKQRKGKKNHWLDNGACGLEQGREEGLKGK